MLLLSPDEVLQRGLDLAGFNARRQANVNHKKNLSRFRTHYASDPSIYAILLVKLQETENDAARVSFDPEEDKRVKRIGADGLLKYFFMAIHFLACYPKEEEAEATFGCSNRTWRKWVWEIVEKIALLKPEIIVWPERWNNPDNPQDPNSETMFIITVDGTHCRVEEPTHEAFSENTKFYSHKFKQAAFDYEIALSIFEDKCVWAAGPYPAGTPDISIFRHKLKQKVLESCTRSGVAQRAIGDKGYRGEREILSVPSSQDTEEVRVFKSRALSRHEVFNARIKTFECMDERFRHTGHPRDSSVSGPEAKHQWCFDSVVVICQLQMENGFPLFRV